MIFTSQLHVTDSCISPLLYFSLSSHGLRAIWSGLNLALATTFLAETLLFLLSSQVIVLVSSSVFDNVKQIVSPTLMVNQHVYCLHFPFTEKENPIYLILLGFCSDCQSHSRTLVVNQHALVKKPVLLLCLDSVHETSPITNCRPFVTLLFNITWYPF